MKIKFYRYAKTDDPDSVRSKPLDARGSESLPLEVGAKTVQLQRVLAYVRVHAKEHFCSLVADVVVGRERHVDVVPDTLHVDGDAVRLFLEDAASKERNHPRAGGR